MELLKRNSIGPLAAIPGTRGKADAYDFPGFCFFAAAAALHHAGMSVLMASRIAEAICDELFAIYGEVPWGASHWRRLPRDSHHLVLDTNGTVVPLRMLREMIKTGALEVSKALENDYKLIIADGVRAYSTSDQRVSVISPHTVAIGTLVPEFYILPLKRGEQTEIKRVSEEDSQEFLDALGYAVGIVQVNISLAVRLAPPPSHRSQTPRWRRSSLDRVMIYDPHQLLRGPGRRTNSGSSSPGCGTLSGMGNVGNADKGCKPAPFPAVRRHVPAPCGISARPDGTQPVVMTAFPKKEITPCLDCKT